MTNNIQEQDLKELRTAFNKMYYNISSALFYKGGTRGHAEQKALEYMDTFVKIKTRENHPMNEFLKQINSEHRKAMAEYIMKDSASDDVFSGNDVFKKSVAEKADKDYRDATSNFGEFYKKYQPAQQYSNNQIVENGRRLAEIFKEMRIKHQGK